MKTNLTTPGLSSFSYYFLATLFSIAIATLVRGWSPYDDFLLFSTSKAGTLWGLDAGNGRLCPLNGLDYYLVDWITGGVTLDNLYIVYLVIAGEFLISAFLLKKVLPTQLNKVVYLLFIFLMLSPASTSVYFRVFFAERLIFLFLLCILFIFLNGYETRISGKISIFFLGFLITFSKEQGIAGMLLLGFGFFLKNRLNKEGNKSSKKIALSLVIPPLTALIIWLVYSLPRAGELYGNAHIPSIREFAPRLAQWMLHDSVLFFLFIPLCIKRAWEIKNKDSMTVYDVFALCGLGCMGIVFILGMGFMYHYLMPVYAVAIPFIVDILFTKGYIEKLIYKMIGILLIPALLAVMSIGVRYIFIQRYNNRNFTELLQLCNKINLHRSSDEIVRYQILGCQKSEIDHFTHSFGTFLDRTNDVMKESAINNENGYDILSYEPIVCEKLPWWLHMTDSLGINTYSYLDPRRKTEHNPGDYVVMVPTYDGPIPPGMVIVKQWSSSNDISLSRKILSIVLRKEFPNRIVNLTLYQIK